MGNKSENNSPRMLYLSIVYIAIIGLWALSTPKSLLDSFQKMRVTLDKGREFKKANVANMFSTFEQTKLVSEPERSEPIYKRAKQATLIMDSLQSFINKIRLDLEIAGGGIDQSNNDVKENGSTDISQKKVIKNGLAKSLKVKLEKGSNDLLNLLDDKEKKQITFDFLPRENTGNGAINSSWETQNFGEGIPLTASLTNLARLQSDIATAEDNIVKTILGSMDKAVVNLDKFSAVAIPSSNYILQGQPYRAELFLTAYDSKSIPVIYVNGGSIAVHNGKGVYNGNTSKEGMYSWYGIIKVKQADGSTKEYKTGQQKYQVAKPSAVVSPTKMNVLYIGVDNPLDVSAPGIAKDKIKINISNGSVSGSRGNYIARVNSLGVVRVTVSAEIGQGKSQILSSSEFRARHIPDPKAKFAGKTGGTLSAVSVRGQDYVSVVLDNFDFDAKFSIQRYTVILSKPRGEASSAVGNSSSLSPAVKAVLSTAVAGSTLIFTDIIVSGPDGQQRSIDPIAIKVN